MHWSEFLDKDVGFWVGTSNLEVDNDHID